MSQVPLIDLTGITKVYGRGPTALAALKGVDFSVETGDFVAVMGPSGSGKSTMMNILGCLDSPTGGSYSFMGVNIENLLRSQRTLLRRQRMGFIFQGFNLLSRTSALENVELPMVYRNEPSSERRKKALEAIRQVGLKGWEHHYPSELSGGQQQRIAIARAIATTPALLLADEPTGNLDTKTSIEIMNLLVEFNREQHITIVMVTHEPDMAAYAGRIITFRDGLIESDTGAKS